MSISAIITTLLVNPAAFLLSSLVVYIGHGLLAGH